MVLKIYKGLRYGMLLQLAVGPICIFIFQMASLKGFGSAIAGVIGVAFIDGLYILAAILGIASTIQRKNTRIILKILGASILFSFGVSTVLGAFNVELIPAVCLINLSDSNSAFYRALIMTASNPLTILFWAGVFSTRISEDDMKRKDICFFGLGAVLSTLLFLTIIAFLGSLTKTFLSSNTIQVLNIAVGLLLIYFSITMFYKKV